MTRAATRATSAWARTLIAVPLLLACAATAPAEGTEQDPGQRVQRVVADPDPSAEEVIEAAGTADQIARADDGSLLLAYYLLDQEGGEDGAAAWRVYDPDGQQVAEHAQPDYGSWKVFGVAGGFVFGPAAETEGFFVDTRGRQHALETLPGERPVERGDVLVSEHEPTLAYRPSAGTLAPLSALPGTTQGVAIDAWGTTWVLPMWGAQTGAVRWTSTSGEQREHVFSLSGGLAPQEFAAGGGSAVVSLAEEETLPDPHVRALVLTVDRGATWETIRSSARLPLHTLTAPSLVPLADGRLLIGERAAGYWLADRDDHTSFQRLNPPAALDTIIPVGDTLYGIAAHTGMWTSTDDGHTWSRYAPDGQQAP